MKERNCLMNEFGYAVWGIFGNPSGRKRVTRFGLVIVITMLLLSLAKCGRGTPTEPRYIWSMEEPRNGSGVVFWIPQTPPRWDFPNEPMSKALALAVFLRLRQEVQDGSQHISLEFRKDEDDFVIHDLIADWQAEKITRTDDEKCIYRGLCVGEEFAKELVDAVKNQRTNIPPIDHSGD